MLWLLRASLRLEISQLSALDGIFSFSDADLDLCLAYFSAPASLSILGVEALSHKVTRLHIYFGIFRVEALSPMYSLYIDVLDLYVF